MNNTSSETILFICANKSKKVYLSEYGDDFWRGLLSCWKIEVELLEAKIVKMGKLISELNSKLKNHNAHP
jgi:hypothetical protein